MKKIILGCLLVGISFGVSAELSKGDAELVNLALDYAESCFGSSMNASSYIKIVDDLKKKGITREQALLLVPDNQERTKKVVNDIYTKGIKDTNKYIENLNRECLNIFRESMKQPS